MPRGILTDLRKLDSPGLRVVASEQGTSSTIGLEGECDLAGQRVMRDAVSRALVRRPECLVLDLSQVTFIDSSGIRAVLAARGLCAARGCDFVVVPGPAQVQRVFELSGLIDDLPFTNQAAGAVAEA